MGYYCNVDAVKGKADILVNRYEGKLVSQAEASKAINDPTKGVIVVVDNGPFEAAAFAYSPEEYDYFINNPMDNRPKQFVIVDRAVAKLLSGYTHN